MSDDIQDDSPVIVGDPMTAAEVEEQVKITMPQDRQSAIEWWNEVSTPLFVDAMGEG